MASGVHASHISALQRAGAIFGKCLIKLMSLLAPRATGALAHWIFTTPPRPVTKIEPKVGPEYRTVWCRTCVLHVAGEGRTVLLLHGWGGVAADWLSVARHLRSTGYRIVLIEVRGHGMGRQLSKRASLADFLQAIREARALFPTAKALLAHSLGGSAAALDGIKFDPLPVTVLISAPLQLEQTIQHYENFLGLSAFAKSNFRSRLEARVGVPVSLLKPELLAGWCGELVLIQDEMDKLIDISDAYKLLPIRPQTKLLVTHGFGHRRILKAEETIRNIDSILATSGV